MSDKLCVELCGKPAGHGIHDPAEGEHCFRPPIGAPPLTPEQAAQEIIDKLMGTSQRVTGGITLMVAALIRRCQPQWVAWDEETPAGFDQSNAGPALVVIEGRTYWLKGMPAPPQLGDKT